MAVVSSRLIFSRLSSDPTPILFISWNKAYACNPPAKSRQAHHFNGAPKCMDRIKIQRNMFKQPHHGIARFFSCCPEGLTACPAPSCKRALATGFQHLLCSKINRKQPNPVKPLKQAPCASLLAENCTLMGATRLANEGLENSQLVE